MSLDFSFYDISHLPMMQIAECWIISTVVQRNWQYNVLHNHSFYTLCNVSCVFLKEWRCFVGILENVQKSENVFVVLILWKKKYALTNFSVFFMSAIFSPERECVNHVCDLMGNQRNRDRFYLIPMVQTIKYGWWILRSSLS